MSTESVGRREAGSQDGPGHVQQEERADRAGQGAERVYPPILSEAEWRSFGVSYGLTPREGEVLRLLCRGYSYEAMGEELGISRPTLRTHLRSAYAKTGCTSRVDLILHIVHHHRPRTR